MLSKGASLVAQRVKRLPEMQETWVRSPGWEDPLEKGMAIHSSTLAWKIPWTEEPGRLQSMESPRVTPSLFLCSQREGRQTGEFLWQTGYVGHANEGVGYSSKKVEFGGSYSLIFIPAPPSTEEEGFLSFSLN